MHFIYSFGNGGEIKALQLNFIIIWTTRIDADIPSQTWVNKSIGVLYFDLIHIYRIGGVRETMKTANIWK